MKYLCSCKSLIKATFNFKFQQLIKMTRKYKRLQFFLKVYLTKLKFLYTSKENNAIHIKIINHVVKFLKVNTKPEIFTVNGFERPPSIKGKSELFLVSNTFCYF